MRPDAVRGLLLALGAAGAFALPFVSLAPNRIAPARPVPLWDAVAPLPLGLLALAGVGLLFAGLWRDRRSHLLALLVAAALLPGLLGMAAAAAGLLMAGGSPAARVSLGSGFWVIVVATALILLDGARRWRAGPIAMVPLGVAMVVAGLAMALAGWLAPLSLARELAARQDGFAAAMLRHLALVGISVGLALPLGAVLGGIAHLRPRAAGPVFAVLGLIQTVPSLALFALLIEPLTGLGATFPALRQLGISGVGMAPAVIAMVLYGLLPVARAVQAGLGSAPPAVLDAARGMGMSDRQVLLRVAMPLALPALLGGVRIVAVQLVGLAVVAALIGAGGLGTLVFQGLGQGADDLVLLGALTVILLALATDGLLRFARAAVEARLA